MVGSGLPVLESSSWLLSFLFLMFFSCVFFCTLWCVHVPSTKVGSAKSRKVPGVKW